MIQHILLLGDSIRMGYAPLVRDKMADEAEILEIPENGGDSQNVLIHLEEWLNLADALSTVHFNCGLHDIKRAYGSDVRQQALPDYVSNLRRIVHLLKARTDAQLIWATMTPVLDERHHTTKGFDRLQRDVELYNAAGLGVMTAMEIPINDLHRVIWNDSVEECLVADGVHMTERGNELLSDAVVAALRSFASPRS